MFSSSVSKEKGAVKFELKKLTKDFDVGFDSLLAVLVYSYSEKGRPLPKGICIYVDEDCFHVAKIDKASF